MKKIRLVCTYAIAFICIMAAISLPKNEIEVFKSTTHDMEDKILIYMMNEENQLVPVTLNYQKSDSDCENILQLFQLMKHEIGSYDLKALIPVSIQCLGVAIQDKLVQLNFNEAFFTMSSQIELRVIEAIVSSIVQLLIIRWASIISALTLPSSIKAYRVRSSNCMRMKKAIIIWL